MRKLLKKLALAAVAVLGISAFTAPSAWAQGWGGYYAQPMPGYGTHGMPQQQTPKKWDAVHEAGHAIFIISTPGLANRLAYVSVRNNERNAARTVFTNVSFPPGSDLSLRYLENTMAGLCAEELIFGPNQTTDASGSDRQTAIGELRAMRIPQQQHGPWLSIAKNKACAKLAPHRRAIWALAQELMQRGRMSGREIRGKYGPMVAGGYR